MQGPGWALLGADLGFSTCGLPGSAQALGKPRPTGSTATLSRCLGFVIQQLTSGLPSSDCHQRMAVGSPAPTEPGEEVAERPTGSK